MMHRYGIEYSMPQCSSLNASVLVAQCHIVAQKSSFDPVGQNVNIDIDIFIIYNFYFQTNILFFAFQIIFQCKLTDVLPKQETPPSLYKTNNRISNSQISHWSSIRVSIMFIYRGNKCNIFLLENM